MGKIPAVLFSEKSWHECQHSAPPSAARTENSENDFNPTQLAHLSVGRARSTFENKHTPETSQRSAGRDQGGRAQNGYHWGVAYVSMSVRDPEINCSKLGLWAKRGGTFLDTPYAI